MSSKKVTVSLNGAFREFEVVPSAKTKNLVFVGEYNEGYGGLAYLDVSLGKVVLVPNVVEKIIPAKPLDLAIDAEYKVVNGKWTVIAELEPEAQQEKETKTKEDLGATNF